MNFLEPDEAEIIVSFINSLSLPDLQFFVSNISDACLLKTSLRKIEVHLLSRGAGRLVEPVGDRAVVRKLAIKKVIEQAKREAVKQ